MKQYIAYQAQHQHGAFDMTSFKYLFHTYIAGEMIQFDYFFPNGLDQPPPSFLLPQKLAKKKLDQMKTRKSHPLGIESPSENGFMEPKDYAFRRWLNIVIHWQGIQ